MTTKQRAYFFELCDKVGLDKNEAKERAKEKYGATHFLDLTNSQVDTLIKILEKELGNEEIEEATDAFPDDFRVWDRDDLVMIYGITLLSRVSWEPSAEPDRWHFMQYTGKCDLDGHKLYDFDIIESYTKSVYLIQWSWKECAWVGHNIETDESIYLSSLGKIKRVGSTYEEVTV